MSARALCLATVLAGISLTGCVTLSLSQGAPGDLVVFHKADFSFVFPETAPVGNEATTRLETATAAGEIVGVGFGVRSRQNLTGVGCAVSDLAGPGGATIPAAAIDPRVVQVWDQKGLRGKNFESIRVCEGLLKDDSINLLDPQYTELNLPSIPPEAPVQTSLRANQSKGFFLTVKVPAGAAAGDYTGTVRVGTAARAATVDLVVHVLPYRLDPPGRTIGMYYNDTIGEETPLPVFRARLAQLRSLGVDALRLVPRPDSIVEDLKEIKAAGFPGPVMLWDEKPLLGNNPAGAIRRQANWLKNAGYEPYVYGIDEPNEVVKDRGVPKSPETAMEVAQLTRQDQVLTTTAISKQMDDQFLSRGIVLDFPLYSIVNGSGLEEYVQRLRAGGDNPRHDHPKDGYYFGCWAENPKRNRLLTGYYLYNSRLDAAFGWTFYTFHMRNAPQIFNDFDLDGNKKRWMTVYPTKEGCAPTLQSEAFREGVNDLRYLVTFLRVAREKEAAGANVTALRNQVLQAVGRYDSYGDAKPEDTTAAQYTDQQFEETRQLIIQATVRLLQ